MDFRRLTYALESHLTKKITEARLGDLSSLPVCQVLGE